MKQPWPFDQPPNGAAVTLRRITELRSQVLVVAHDADDHGWQFLDGSEASTGDAQIVSMSQMVGLDATLLEVADLLPGWIAQRSGVGERWEYVPATAGGRHES